MEHLRGLTAVVTGGGSGFGRALANAFGAAGMAVVVADLDGTAADATVDELNGRGWTGLAIECDVSDPASVEHLAARTVAQFGEVHLLCNNAGVLASSETPESTPADWKWTLGVNLYGVVHGLHTFLPRMRSHGKPAHVVNVASFGGLLAGLAPGIAPYVASKFAVVGLTEQLRPELAREGIGITVVCPTGMPTQIHVSARNRTDISPIERQKVDERLLASTRHGVEPAHLATLTVDAVRANRLYVVNRTPLRDMLRDRFAEIDAAFEHDPG
jgi:NAD(P)-dependent dehydrogenase (short-subunit alcohol dehydrogenase family)